MGTVSTLIQQATFGLGLLGSFGAKVDVIGIYSNGGNSPPTGTSSGSGLSGISGALTNNGIVNSLLGQSNLTQGFGQMFANARPMKATIRETSRVMDHPVETGVTLSDHHIINPVEIDIPLVVTSTPSGLISSLLGGATTAQNYASTYAQIRQAFIDAKPLTVKTRVGVYSNMIIADMPHEEDAEMFDAITIGLRLKQVIYVLPLSGALAQNFQPASATNSNTISSGLQSALGISGTLLTTGLSVASYASAAGKRLL